MTSLPSVHHDHSCSPITQEAVCAALTARLNEWPEICVVLASVLYPHFSVTPAPCHSAVLLVERMYVILRERSPDGALLIVPANHSCGVSLRKRYVSERIGDIVELYVNVSWHCFTISVVFDSPDPQSTSKSLSMKCGVTTNSSYVSVATVSLINYCVCRNQLNFMNSAKTDMTTGCNCKCTLSEH